MMRKGKTFLCGFIVCVIISFFPFPCSCGEEITSSIIAEVTTERGPLKLRKEPKKSAKVLAELERGSYITVLESGEEWCLVDDGSRHGYAMTQFLTIQEDVDERVLSYYTLQNGDCGDEVIALKQRLMELGYFRADSKMTNRYNDTVIQRMKMFQKQNGLEEDGVATPQVQALLFSEDAKENTESIPDSPTHYQRAGGSSNESGGSSDDDGWKKVVCECCGGEGCDCCDYTGWIWVHSSY